MRFHDPDPHHRPHGVRAILRWGVWERYVRPRPIAEPGPPAPAVAPCLDLLARLDGPPRLTWIGHASFLGSLAERRFLIDPVFSRKVGWVCRRHGAPGLLASQLPPVDLLLVTHGHYDHLDAPSILALPRELAVVVPLGLGRWFRRRGFARVTELGWWGRTDVGPLRVTLVPARHWSRRGLFDTNRTLWGGFVVEGGGRAIYHSGDSAWFEGFAEIGRRFPGLLAAMIAIGAYAPAWFMERQHMSPEQAGRAFLELGARHLVPMHWGAFKLSDEPLVEPIERVRRWWSANVPADRRLHVLATGETVTLDDT